jgi:hypothetical protein
MLVAAAMAVTIAAASTGVAQAQNGLLPVDRLAVPTGLGFADWIVHWPFRGGKVIKVKVPKHLKYKHNLVAQKKFYPPVESAQRGSYHYKKFKKIRVHRSSNAFAHFAVGTAFCAAGSTLFMAMISPTPLPGQVAVDNLFSCVFPPYGIYLMLGGQPIVRYE